MPIIRGSDSHVPIRRLTKVKKWCPLDKNFPMTQIGDYVFHCDLCGYEVNESDGSSAYHTTVLVSRPSVYSYSGAKKYHIKEERTRSDDFKELNKEFEKVGRQDPQSMYNVHHNLQDGKSTKNMWINAQYCNMSLDYTEDELKKLFAKFKR